LLFARIRDLEQALCFWLPQSDPPTRDIKDRVMHDLLLLIGAQFDCDSAEARGWVKLQDSKSV
jgi:hypothetical protein